MSLADRDDQFKELRDVLLPVLAEAAIGRFHNNVPVQKESSHELNELLMGVQILLETVRQQQEDLQASQAELHEVRDRTTEILARVFDRNLPVERHRL